MTSPSDPTGWAQWDEDYANLQAAGEQTQEDVDQYNTDKNNYYAIVGYTTYDDKGNPTYHPGTLQEVWDSQGPEAAMIYLLEAVLASMDPDNHANIMGLYDDQTTIYADEISANACETEMSNDLQSLYNGSSGVPEAEQVDTMNACLGQLAWTFGTDPKTGKPNDPDVYNSFDPETCNSILTQVNAMQTTMDTYFDPDAVAYVPANDPNSPDFTGPATFSSTQVTTYNNAPAGTYTCYYYKTDANGVPIMGPDGQPQGDPSKGYYTTNKMASFDDMQNRMAMKTTGDNPATTAADQLSQSSQILTTISNNVSNMLNQQVQQSLGMQKNWESLMGAFAKNILTESSYAVQRQIAG